MDYAKRYFEEVQVIAKTIDLDLIEKMVQIIADVKKKQGRLFFIGVGGSAANCTHAVNDFRKIGSPPVPMTKAGIQCTRLGWNAAISMKKMPSSFSVLEEAARRKMSASI